MGALLNHKKAVITGASRGIGEAIARLFLAEGASVALMGRSKSLETLRTEYPEKTLAFKGDITDNTYLKQVFQSLRENWGTLDVLVNNAGILKPGKLGMIALADIQALFDINCVAVIQTTQYAARLMSQHNHASIINLTSIAGTQGTPGFSAYCASKAAIVGLTHSLSKELAPQGIRVNAIAPGFIDTPMTRQFGETWFNQRIGQIPFGRAGMPQDVANTALYLASDLSTYVTGQIIGVDGAMRA